MCRIRNRKALVLLALVAATVAIGSKDASGQYRLSIDDDNLVHEHDRFETVSATAQAAETSVEQVTFASDCGCDSYSCSGGCNPSRNWIRADYLLWWTKGNRVPPLVTSSPAGTVQVDAGILGVAGTQTLFGGNKIAEEERSGFRVNFGRWLDDCQTWAIEGTYFSVFDEGGGDFFAQTTGGPGSGAPILARPFFDANAGIENARLFSFPGLADGSIDISTSSELHSAEALLRWNARTGTRGTFDIIGGYRYFRLREGLSISEDFTSTGAGGGLAVGTQIAATDIFETANDFHGGQLGMAFNVQHAAWNLELLGKVALGNMHRTINIAGSTTTTTPPPGSTTSTAAGGLLALTSNIGQTTENDLAVLPEFSANVSVAIHERLSLQAGYSILAINNVSRTGDQIDRTVNPNLFPGGTGAGASQPARQFNAVSDFWAQGVNFGVVGEF